MIRFILPQSAIRLLILFLACNLPAGDWPQWRGVHRDGIAVGEPSMGQLPLQPKVVWKLKVGDGLASPVVAGGKLFHFDSQGGKEVLHALEARTGRELWAAAIDESFHDEQGPDGPRCTPLIDEDRVYAQSCRGELRCFAVTDGMLLWRANFLKDFDAVILGEDSKVPGAAEHGYTASPIVIDDQLIASVGGTNGAGIVSFEKRTGKVLWKSQNDLASYASPVRATLGGVDQLVFFTVEGVIGIEPRRGRLLWRIPLHTSYGRNVTTPVVVRDWVVVGSYQAGLVGIRIRGSGENLQSQIEWTNKAAAMNFSSPVVRGDFLYGLGPARDLICVEVETGRIRWSKSGFWGASPDVAYGALIALEKEILVSTDEGQVILIAADSEQCRELGRAQICGRNWCHPAMVDGRAYIRSGLHSQGMLWCVELR